MSKELELLKQIRRVDGNMSREQNQRYAELEQALTPPTADEVCKALCDFTNWEVKYSTETKEFYRKIENTECVLYITETYGDGNWTLGAYLPPHLITLIGRFYEVLEK